MQLVHIPAQFVDRAWTDGASALSKACDASGGEITGDQLKMLLSRGERNLVRLDDDGKAVGWAVWRIDQLPNMRVFFITDLYAPNCGFERFIKAAREVAEAVGCSRVRCAAKPAQARLYQSKLGFSPVYTILEMQT
jgi:hypothetical protein